MKGTILENHRLRSKKPLEPAMATDWSITHSPTPRYLSIHFETSLFSPATLSLLKLEAAVSPSLHHVVLARSKAKTYVRPVERFTPARKADTVTCKS